MTHLISRGQPLEPGYLNNLRVGVRDWGVISGLAVSQRAAGANMSVDVATGSATINGTVVTKSSVTNVVVTAAHATYDRYDFVVINSSGTISVIAGTAAATSYAPDYDFETNNAILLAEIYIPATDTAIENAQITDKRVIVLDVADVAQDLIDIHTADTTAVHGIVDTSAILLRRYFPAPSVNVWTNEPYIDDDNNANAATHSSSGASSGNYITYDFGAVKNFILGGRYSLYNSNAVLTVGLRVEISDDGATWYTVLDQTLSAATTIHYLMNLIGRARYVRFEAYYVSSSGARTVSIYDLNLIY